jgi:predicted transcriptional regulator of viral defense system
MGPGKYSKQLESLLKKPFFTASEAVQHGITRQALAYFTKKGVITRICPGVYRAANYEPSVEFQWEDLALVAASIPSGVICLISALCYYDLTDQIMREIWIAVSHSSHPPKRPNTKIIRMRNLELGKTKIGLGEYHVQIFDRERCIVDAFRYLSKEIALKALQRYFRGTNYRPKLQKLAEYAKILRVDIIPYILAYTT